MADTNRVKVRYARETTWGEAVVNGPAATEFRLTGETLRHAKQTVVSQEIRSDRQRADLLEVGQSGIGDLQFELTYGEFESWYETALRDTIVSTTKAEASTTFAASTITGVVLTQSYNAFVAGQWVIIGADGNANDNAVAQVVSATSSVLSITGTTLTAGVASSNVTGRTLANGTTKTSFFVEADFEDLTGIKYFSGVRPDQASIAVQSQQIVTGVFSCQAKRGFTASTSVASTVVTSAGATTPMTAAVNVGTILENGALISEDVQSITLQLANNMRQRPRVGDKTSAEHGDGGVDVTGNLTLYTGSNLNLYGKMINHTATALSMKFKDDAGNVIVISLPKTRYSDGDPTTPGQDQDVFLPLNFTATIDPVTGKTIRMDFLPVQ
jgi:hypothetical protein